MRATQFFIPTLHKSPSDARLISHKFLVRGGFIRQLAAGIYTFLPLGWRVVRKIEEIVREEMNIIGAQELMMPVIHPMSLWKESGRWEIFNQMTFQIIDNRRRTNFILGPTHEAVITDLIKGEVRSYRQLPLLLYQIQTKARDEPRPSGGLIRCREFIMKDLYSFDADEDGLNESYHKVYHAYERIFERIGLDHVITEASGGAIGGSETREFHALCENGEEHIFLCECCGYAADLDMATIGENSQVSDEGYDVITSPALKLEKVSTPDAKTVRRVTKMLNVTADRLVKTMIYMADGEPVAALVRGDRELNETKLKATLNCQTLEMADLEAVERLTSAPVGFAGPVGLSGVRIIADKEIKAMNNFITGANEADAHLINVNLDRDFTAEQFADIRNAVAGDPCSRCNSQLLERNGIEVAHIFKLGDIYSKNMGATFVDANGREKPLLMGCYGLGITRLVAAVVETNCDKSGITWPMAIAPFQVIILLLNSSDKTQLKLANDLYAELRIAEVEVLLDDRRERPGTKFNDADLIGIPIQIIVGRYASEGKVEIQLRKEGAKEIVEKDGVSSKVKEFISAGL